MTAYLSTASLPRRLRANWPALLLPAVAADTSGLVAPPVHWIVTALAVVMVLTAPVHAARLAPFALLAYGLYGLLVAHALLVWEYMTAQAWQPMVYGVMRVGPAQNAGFLLPQAMAFCAAGVALLARPGAPGGALVRLAVRQLRGTGGLPGSVPPLLLLPVLFLWEELFCVRFWFGAGTVQKIAALILVLGVAAVVWLPRAAAVAAVAGTVAYGLGGAIIAVTLWNSTPWHTIFYGAIQVSGSGVEQLLACLQGAVLLGLGCAVAPRLLTGADQTELARRAQALTQRVDRLTRTRSDATEVAVTELRRIERDLHDGAQARLVALGMSLRGAEKLFASNPEAALALVAEARETSSRALADLRNLVRGIYPPVLADRGLADALRALALEVPLPADVDVDLPGEPTMPVAAAVYFGVAEALTNAVRHGQAATVQVSVRYTGGALRASVADDGHGGADASLGTGLAGVERRLATFDGIVSVTSPAGGPTIVAIEVPCALSSAKTSSS